MLKYVLINLACAAVCSILYAIVVSIEPRVGDIFAIQLVMIAITLIIPAKVFANDHREPPTKEQITSFAIGATIVDAGFFIAAYTLSDYSLTKNPGIMALCIFIGIVLSYLIAYRIFGMYARKFAERLKEKDENNCKTSEP